MAERVGSTGGGNTNQPRTPQTPITSPAADQAAAEFASLLSNDSTSTPQTSSRQVNRDSSQGRSVEDPKHDRERGSDEPVERKEGDKREPDRKGESEGKKGETQPPSPGDAILQSLGKSEVAATHAAAQTEGVNSPHNLEGIVQQVADRMLVSEGAAGSREVRISLKDSVLPGTEIRISQQGGKLQIQFVTDSAKSQELLAQNQGALQDRLNEKLSRNDVAVSIAKEAEGHGDQQDGRSRQQRDIIDEAERDD